MRRLAERLGIKAASLYRHVRDKDELLVLLGDEICAGIPTQVADGPWQAQLAEMAKNCRRGLLAHRDAARVLASTAPFGPRRLHLVEMVLRALRAAGLSAVDTARAAYHVNNFVTEFVADEARFAAAAAAMGGTRRKVQAEVRKHFQSLPAAEFPLLRELAEHLAGDDSDALFEFGIGVWLRGLEKLAKSR